VNVKKSPAAEPPSKGEKKRKGKVRTVPVIYYSILSKSSGNCIAIKMAEKKNGGVAIEWTSRLAHEQQWRVKPVEGHWFQLIARHSGRALTIRDTSRDPVIQGNTASGKISHWKLISDTDGFVRITNRSNGQCIGVSQIKGSHGDGLILSDKADSDLQKWGLQITEIDYGSELISKQLAIPASELIGKKHPTTTEELKEFLHRTKWSIRYGSFTGTEEYRMTFDRKGTLKLHTGRVSKLNFLGPKTIKLWAYDHASLSDQFNYFRAVDCNDKVYYGVLLPD